MHAHNKDWVGKTCGICGKGKLDIVESPKGGGFLGCKNYKNHTREMTFSPEKCEYCGRAKLKSKKPGIVYCPDWQKHRRKN